MKNIFSLQLFYHLVIPKLFSSMLWLLLPFSFHGSKKGLYKHSSIYSPLLLKWSRTVPEKNVRKKWSSVITKIQWNVCVHWQFPKKTDNTFCLYSCHGKESRLSFLSSLCITKSSYLYLNILLSCAM